MRIFPHKWVTSNEDPKTSEDWRRFKYLKKKSLLSVQEGMCFYECLHVCVYVCVCLSGWLVLGKLYQLQESQTRGLPGVDSGVEILRTMNIAFVSLKTKLAIVVLPTSWSAKAIQTR